jgi:hypothetical protein
MTQGHHMEGATAMSQRRSKMPSASGFGRVLVYYVVFLVVLIALVELVPFVRDAVSGTSIGVVQDADRLLDADGAAPVGTPLASGPWTQALLAAISMFGALAIMMPVTWVYMITRRHRGYDESVVHTLLILPVTVAGILMVVQSTLALAFSLAGIVAAVRFRTTLDDTKDAVYVFLAIGVGIALGVQAIGIALALSVVFNIVVLVIWKTQFGNIYADAKGAALGLGDVLAGPESAYGALSVGDPAVLAAAAPQDLAEIAERAARLERYISEERAKKKSKRANALILVHATAAGPAQAYVDALLEELAARWKLIEVGPAPSGSLLQYLARFDGAAVEGAVMDRIREAPEGVISAAEMRSLKGLKSRA